MVHSYQNCLYESMKNAPKNLWRMAAHGNYLNESAHCYAPSPWIGFNGSKDWFEEILCEHAIRPVPSHAFFDRQLMAASPFLTFVTKARTIVFQELKRAGLGMIDAEAYFLCSVLHSVDHWQMGKYVEWVDFDDNLKYTKRFNYMSRNFFQHSQYWFLPNNYFRSHYRENKLYERMYLRMKEADPMYAAIISISVTY